MCKLRPKGHVFSVCKRRWVHLQGLVYPPNAQHPQGSQRERRTNRRGAVPGGRQPLENEGTLMSVQVPRHACKHTPLTLSQHNMWSHSCPLTRSFFPGPLLPLMLGAPLGLPGTLLSHTLDTFSYSVSPQSHFCPLHSLSQDPGHTQIHPYPQAGTPVLTHACVFSRTCSHTL